MKTFFLCSLLSLATLSSYAQQSRRQKLDSLYKNYFFLTAVSAVLLPKGYVEINNAATLLTANRIFTDEFKPEPLYARSSTFSNLLQLTYGISQTGQFNVGVDILYSAFRLDPDSDASPWKVFSRDSALARTNSLNTIGLRFRYQPFIQRRQFLLQGFLYVPVDKTSNSQTTARLQAVYIVELSRKVLFLYLQAGAGYSFAEPPKVSAISIPATAILQYQIYLNKNRLYKNQSTLGLMGLVGNTIVFTGKNSMNQTSFGLQVGGGMQYQYSLQLGVTGFYTRYIAGRNASAYDTINLGVRLII